MDRIKKDVIEQLGFRKEEINENYTNYLVYKSNHKVGTGTLYFDYEIKFYIPKDIRKKDDITCIIFGMWNGRAEPIDFELSKAIYQKMCELKGVEDDVD